MSRYTQLSLEERCSIARLREAGQSIRQIAATLDRQPSTIARELKRKIRQEVETRLAKEILGDALKPGDSVEIDYDKDSDEVKFNKIASPTGSDSRSKTAKAPNGEDVTKDAEGEPPAKGAAAAKGRKKRSTRESGASAE